jgi:lysophospholipase L1-like esterase
VLMAGCGGSSHGVPGASSAVSGVVFYDENNNGSLDAGEDVRVPGVVVRLASLSATSGPGGAFALSPPSAGGSIEATPEGLPPFFQAVPVRVGSPPPATVAVPLQLSIGANRPNVYMGFGDSITAGQGSESGRGYLGPLNDRLVRAWGRATVVNEAEGGTTSDQGAARISGALSRERPAYTLIDYGTNDYSHLCRKAGACLTDKNLRLMVRETRRMGSLPVLATLLPGNAPSSDPSSIPRDRWVRETNDLIRQVAREEGAALADPFTAFDTAADPARLFADYLHPNDRGYELVADAFFVAITSPRK